MKNNVPRKGLVVGIILLFISITFSPSINFNIVKASDDNELIEVTTQAYGIKGFGDTTVKLTKHQYQDLQQYLVDFRERLNKTTTREEAVPIFNEAVIELNKYGLLPKGMSVENAQNLVNNRNEKIQSLKKINNLFFSDQNSKNTIKNVLCLISGNVDEADFWSLLSIGSFILLQPFIIAYALLVVSENPIESLLIIISILALPVLFILEYGRLIKPINLISIIIFGEAGIPTTSGSIFSLGLYGKKNVNGNFSGVIVGFTGLRITAVTHYPNDITVYGGFFLGSALWESINNPNNKLI